MRLYPLLAGAPAGHRFARISPVAQADGSRARPLSSVLLRPPRHPRPLPRMRHNSRQGNRMKRLWRIILNALTVLSLALCIATIPAWGWSYKRTPFARILIESPAQVKSATTAQAEAWERVRASHGWNARYSVRYLAVACRRGRLYLFLDDDREIAMTADWSPAWLRCGADANAMLVLEDDPPIARFSLGASTGSP